MKQHFSPHSVPMLPPTRSKPVLHAALLAVTLVLQACSSAPKAPDWQMEAKGAMDRATAAYLAGDTKVEAAEFTRARRELSSTGRAELMASAELLHCAARVASLVFEPCAGFESLRPDANAAQQAYADYLRGQWTPAQTALLPAPQRTAASRAAGDAQALQGIEDPLSILVAAGVLLQTGKANPAVIEQAVNTASSQGWRRPLLAWLGVQLERARQAGQTAEAARVQRRMEWVQGGAPGAQ
jgi:hypothetical protein